MLLKAPQRLVDQEPSRAHRILTALAATSVLVTLTAPWQLTIERDPIVGMLLGVAFIVVLALIGVACAGRTVRSLALADLTVLVITLGATAVDFVPFIRGEIPVAIDESILTSAATRALEAGHDPYDGSWAHLVAANPTPLMNGRIADRFGYPPLTPTLAAGLHLLMPGVTEPTVLLGLVAIIATAVIVFVTLPVWLRPLTALAVVTVSVLPNIGQHGYPMTIGLPFLVLAVLRWPRIGRGGRLGRWGVLQALALGVATTAQQEAWFLVPFLAVVIWRLRRGELDRRASGLLVGRYVGIVVAVFAAVDLPFVVAGPRSWLDGVLDPLLQHAVFDGPGLMNLSLRIVGGSGGVDFYGYASLLLVLAMLLAVACWPRQLAPAAVVLPFVAFWFSLRTQPIYYEVCLPATFMAIATVELSDFATARPLWARSGTRRAHRERRARDAVGPRVLAPAVLVVAALACVVVAVGWPAPLQLSVRGVSRDASRRLTSLQIRVDNISSGVVQPHFATTLGDTQSLFWIVQAGPRELSAGQAATYTLVPSPLQVGPRPRTPSLWVVSDNPQTLSSVVIPSGTRTGSTPRVPRSTLALRP